MPIPDTIFWSAPVSFGANRSHDMMLPPHASELKWHFLDFRFEISLKKKKSPKKWLIIVDHIIGMFSFAKMSFFV